MIIGLDGATFDLILPWAQQGQLPTFKRFIQQGAWGHLASTTPPVTSPAWPTFMTGKNAGKHGVFDFIEHGQDKQCVVNASHIDGKTLWQLVSDAGKRVGIMNVPVTYPATPVNGFLLSGMPQPRQGRRSYPEDLWAECWRVMDEVGPLDREGLAAGDDGRYVEARLGLLARRRHLALWLIRTQPWELFVFYTNITDIFQHRFWKHMDVEHPEHAQANGAYRDTILEAYQRCDVLMAELIAAAGEDTITLVMSDHGFGPLHGMVNLNRYFLEEGLLYLKPGLRTRAKHMAFQAGITPQKAFGVARRLGVQGKVTQLSRQTQLGLSQGFLSFNDVDWSRTQAYSLGHMGQVHINLRGRQPRGSVAPGAEYERVRQRVIELLQALKHPDTGEPLVDQILTREEAVVPGPHYDEAPDLFVRMQEHRYITYPLFMSDGRLVTRHPKGESGTHRSNGVLAGLGPGVKPGEISRARIVDLAPTLLYALDVPVPDDMDGRVLTELFTESFCHSHDLRVVPAAADGKAARSGFSEEEEAEVVSRLRDLGYL
jgi:predicted AlkP superfamily phosphohydrolase/phosphomutase